MLPLETAQPTASLEASEDQSLQERQETLGNPGTYPVPLS